MNREAMTLGLVVSTAAGTAWRGWLELFHGNFYHSAPWAETWSSDHSRPLFFHWSDNNGCCMGIAVGIESWSPIRYIGHFFKRLDFETYPAVRDGDVTLTRSMIEQLMAYARYGGYGSLSMQSYGASVTIPHMAELGFATKPRIEFIIDLKLSEGKLWNLLSQNHRRKLRKANKHGLVFKEFRTADAIGQLRRLQASSSDRRKKRREYAGMPDSANYEDFGKSYVEKDLGKIFLMFHENQAVSGALITVYAGKAYYVAGGSNDEGIHRDAPVSLFWNILSCCRDLGCKEFNLGGVPASSRSPEDQAHGLYRFKSGFGGREVACLSGKAENLGPLLGTLQNAAKRGWHLWKSL